ncbi:PAS domain S-box protein [Fictibacillus sp. 5RED26]|uniref:PAS domain-containing sensor histidine kinase n=1 Tax=Fictibacillus TaxID=1329200 RepID=UPI0018CF6B43|nr:MULTISPECIES: PAS domain-containing sensor histidine kinase [unclassified Fictibacillus]MBH0154991.1 PAS domain S-box protein [Fictibacillus sp. 5RED26]MBH0165226.1 PAS domain S-box protein [Fictibacillus sp. 7GRE50]
MMKVLSQDELPAVATLKEMIDVLPEFVCLRYPDGTWAEANRFALNIYGINHDEYKGKSLEELDTRLSYEAIERCSLSDKRAWETRKPIKTAEKILMKSGRKVMLELIKQPTFTSDGKPQVLVITGRDITPHKQKEEELSVALDLLESVLKGTTDAILIINTRQEVIKVNDAFNQMFGWAEEDFSEDNDDYPVITPEHLQGESKEIIDLLKQGQSVPLHETQRIHKDGTVFDVSASFSNICDMDGKIMGFVIVYRDITSQKKVERALRESEAKYRLIAEHSTDLITVIDPSGIIQYVSPSHLPVLGYEDGEIKGAILEMVHPEDIQSLSDQFMRALVKKEPFQTEFRLLHKNGDWILLEARGVPVMTKDGHVESLVTFARDVTKAKQTEELMLKSEKLSVLGELAAGVAHEIRNPLTSLKGFTKLLSDADDVIRLEYLRIMESELNRINDIVGELMLVAKPQAVSFEHTNIQELIYSVVRLLETQAIMKNIQIWVNISDNIPLVYGVENQLKQLFINLLKNAIESMDKDGEIHIKIGTRNDSVLLELKDQGCGIPAERLKTLGEPFYTTKEKGTGLGLMVCFKIIEEHGGAIQFSSVENEGTKVEIELPTAPSSSK